MVRLPFLETYAMYPNPVYHQQEQESTHFSIQPLYSALKCFLDRTKKRSSPELN